VRDYLRLLVRDYLRPLVRDYLRPLMRDYLRPLMRDYVRFLGALLPWLGLTRVQLIELVELIGTYQPSGDSYVPHRGPLVSLAPEPGR
jgi:hypothetical protein